MRTCKTKRLEIFPAGKLNKRSMMVAVLSVLTALTLMTTISVTPAFAEDAPAPSAEAAVVMSATTGEVIYSNHGDRKLPMAGAAKLMTAMVVLDNMHNYKELKNKIQIDSVSDDQGDLFQKNETVSVNDLLYALLINDSDEAAYALAVYSSGSVATFTGQMNQKASQMGLLNTKFTNPSGANEEGQYSTAVDTGKMLKAAMKYQKIRKILGLTSYTMKATDMSQERTLTSRNELLTGGEDGNLKLSGIEGGILSHETVPPSTDEGGTPVDSTVFAVIGERDGMAVMTILMNEPDNKRVEDATNLMNYGFKNVTKKIISKEGVDKGKVRVRYGEETRVPVYTASKGYVYIPPEGSNSLVQVKTDIYSSLKAPVKAGTKAGELKIYVADEYQGSVDLIVKQDVKTGWFPSSIYISNRATIIICVILLAIFAVFLRIIQIRRRNIKRKKARRKAKAMEIARRQLEIEEDRRKRNWYF